MTSNYWFVFLLSTSFGFLCRLIVAVLAHGGIGAVHRLAQHSGLGDAINQKPHRPKISPPNYEADHVLNPCNATR